MSDNRSNPTPGLLHEPIPGLPVVFEDASLIVVDKPSGMLSQPGRQVSDSVLERVLQARPQATGPVMVHRLDMDTSGLLLLAKNRTVHRMLQQQFEHRRIGKRYLARLSAVPTAMGGRIHLPLRVDIDDRPRQVVCEEHGKTATTVWHRCKEQRADHVWLYPLTGRTHQLRVHLAHPRGLGIAIEGDRLYQDHYESLRTLGSAVAAAEAEAGQSRTFPDVGGLMLHAQLLAFDHPLTGIRQSFQSTPPFGKIG
ncbi:RluA family pseudouridine synthase [Granulosicoccus sp. 3-233]|uniref:RluA family pseudouridine synthase n=1 Tax=Granulosicoccus sp. 3-233 TaxID=3417969 RepID=UPI003D355CE7